MMRALIVGIALSASVAACAEPSATVSAAREGPPVVAVVNHPLEFFVRELAGDGVEVAFPAPPDEDPAFWRPDDDAIASFQQADLVFLNGAGYADWVRRTSLRPSRVVDTSRGHSERLIAVTTGATHAHGPEGEHADRGHAFTTWLDPDLARSQMRAVAARLSKLTDVSGARIAALDARLDELDAACESVRQSAAGMPLLASHPVYQYLARRCELDLVSLHWEPDTAPTAQQWEELQRTLADHPASWMIWEDEPLPATRRRLEGMSIRVAVIRPCGATPPSGDMLANVTSDLHAFAEALGNDRD